jgi:hypothetical protein
LEYDERIPTMAIDVRTLKIELIGAAIGWVALARFQMPKNFTTITLIHLTKGCAKAAGPINPENSAIYWKIMVVAVNVHHGA